MSVKMGKNKTIHGGERTLILKVLHFFEEQKRRGRDTIPVEQALKRTCAATGVSLSTLSRIKREEKSITEIIRMKRKERRISETSLPDPTSKRATSSPTPASTEQTTTSSSPPTSFSEQSTSFATRPVVRLPTPGRRRGPAHNKLYIDDFTIAALRDIIIKFTERKEVPTLKKILAVAKADLNFPGQKETLRKVLVKKLGYTFKTCWDKGAKQKASYLMKPGYTNSNVIYFTED